MSYQNNADGGIIATIEMAAGRQTTQSGALLIGADSIHSGIRAQMHPYQPPIHWGGAIMLRGTTRSRPIRTGSSFIGLSTHKQRVVLYPISPPDTDGLPWIRWISEVTYDDPAGRESGWFKPTSIDIFIHHFEDCN